MANILISEWRQRLAVAAALHASDDGAKPGLDDAHWSAPMGLLRVRLGLMTDPGTHAYMVPELRGDGGGAPDADPMVALAQLRDAEAVLVRAVGCYATLRYLRIYPSDCPCDSCGGRGHAYRNPGRQCSACGGAKVRNEPEVSGG